VDIVAIAAHNQESADRRAKDLNVDRAYGRFEDLITDPDIDVVHNTTPNDLHCPVNRLALAAGKHIICDNPWHSMLGKLVSSVMPQLRQARHTYWFSTTAAIPPFSRRVMISAGELGTIPFIHGQYLQDWLTAPEVYTWRLDPSKGGASSALRDIGSHWCDLAQHVSGARIVSVLADLTTVVPVRYVTDQRRQAFSKERDTSGTTIEMVSEDLASVLLRFNSGAKGSVSVGQVCRATRTIS
jgi:predicted dehydrogenase